jgi:hypothetical protein
MFSNLRSIPIEGHITDSAGNVLRNVQVIIKQQTPTGSVIIDTVNSDDSGYFITNPIPNGIYDIYESGVRLSRIVHDNGNTNFQCFQASFDNYNQSIISNFAELAEQSKLNSYKSFIQLEPENLNISQFGNSFPIYDKDISDDPDTDPGAPANEIYNIAKFFSLTNKSRITTSRFDIEYFLPITSTSLTYKRVKWAGVPGIKFYEDSKIVLPLDYYSIVSNNPKKIVPASSSFAIDYISVAMDYSAGTCDIIETADNGALTELVKTLFVGDILKMRFKEIEGVEIKYWYGIVTKIDYSPRKTIFLERWRSSRFYTDPYTNFSSSYIQKIHSFDGMFSNIMDIGQDVNINQLFTVVENFSVQNQEIELYNYINQE